MRSHPAFQRGLAVAVSGGGLLLVALYTLYAPTTDIRARIPFLLDLGGGLLTLVALLMLLGAGVVALWATRPLSKEALGGVALGAVANLAMLTSGLLGRVLPPFEPVWQRVIAFGIAAILVGTVLWRERRSVTSHSSGSDATESALP